MSLSSTPSATSSATSPPKVKASGNSLGAALAGQSSSADSEQRFLKLLVTQLGNQDPLNPLDNAQLTSQLAQMSTVSGIEKLNAALSSLVSQSAASQVLQSASLIGRSVQASGLSQASRVLSVAQSPGGLLLELEGGLRVNLADVQLIS